MSEGQDGKLLVKCHAGCDQGVVWAALQDRGHVEQHDDRRTQRAPRRPRRRAGKPRSESSPNQDYLLKIWKASRDPIGKLTGSYLNHRAITGKIPRTIRDHPNLKHGPTGLSFPTMVAAITGADRKVRPPTTSDDRPPTTSDDRVQAPATIAFKHRRWCEVMGMWCRGCEHGCKVERARREDKHGPGRSHRIKPK